MWSHDSVGVGEDGPTHQPIEQLDEALEAAPGRPADAGVFGVAHRLDERHTQLTGVVVEARVNGGKLLVCSIDLVNDLQERPVARQLRHSLLKYAASRGSTGPSQRSSAI